MPNRAKYAPKHRHVPEPRTHRGVGAPSKALRTGLVMTSTAVAVTGIAVSGGLLAESPDQLVTTAHDLGSNVDGQPAAASLDRTVVSRSSDRRDTDPAKVDALSTTGGPARTASVDVRDGDPRDIARALMPQFGFAADQFDCLDSLWTRESHWNVHADNPNSSAYGIPQALTAGRDMPADYMTNPVTQITWGLDYIQDRYGSPCGAWAHSQSRGWY